MVAGLQMCPFVGENVFAGSAGQTHGNINARADIAQNKGGLNAVAFPAADDLHRLADGQLQMHIGNEGIQQHEGGNGCPDDGQQLRPMEYGRLGSGGNRRINRVTYIVAVRVSLLIGDGGNSAILYILCELLVLCGFKHRFVEGRFHQGDGFGL